MIRYRPIFVIILALCLTIFEAPHLWAQTGNIVDEVPLEYEADMEEWHSDDEILNSPFHRQRFQDKYAEKITTGEIYHVANQMIQDFNETDWQMEEDKRRLISDQLKLFLNAMKDALDSEGIDPPLDRKVEQNIFLNKMGGG
jgi:hypothetical protein